MNKNNIVYIHNKCYSALKKKLVLPFIAVWTNVDDIMLTEINQNGKATTTYIRFLK
jgi:hypothetical protein